MSLYRVRIETDIMVMASTPNEAVKIAKTKASEEIAVYCEGTANVVSKITDIPESWKNSIPYVPSNISLPNITCLKIIENMSKPKVEGDDTTPEDVENIIKIKGDSKGMIENKIERPKPKIKIEESKPEWKDVKSGRSLPKLRFNIPYK
jgi:hypothetical protein